MTFLKWHTRRGRLTPHDNRKLTHNLIKLFSLPYERNRLSLATEHFMKRGALLALFLFILHPMHSFANDSACSGWMTQGFYATATAQDIRECLWNGASLSDRDPAGRTPLHLASSITTDIDTIAALLRAGANTELTDKNLYWKPIHVAAAEGQSPELLTFLAVWGADVNAKLSGGRDCYLFGTTGCATTPIHLAAKRSDSYRYVLSLLAAGANLDQEDEKKRTALHYTVENSADTFVVESLLQAGASIDAADDDNLTALHIAASREEGGLEMLAVLLEAGASVTASNSDGMTPLHTVAQRTDDSLQMVKLLLDNGASADIGDKMGSTPLMWAARNTTNIEVIKNLVSASENPCFKDEQGRSALSQWDLNQNIKDDRSYWELHDRCNQ